nr:acyltransferase family protein [Arthrobacter jiangjiafuii]
MRALAVLMVVTYHIWFGRVSGGVDVFLLISAFLLSLSFIRKVESGRPLELGRYWLHRFKRLLPPVSVVLVGTLAATTLFVPQTRWTEILSQTWSSLLYFQNWALAAESVDYYAVDHSTASPLQHFWSLSVQGQVFLLWPLLFAAAALLARILRVRYRFVILVVFGALFGASLWFSIEETYGNQAHAYFDTRTRLWEFALGTLLALALPYLKPVRWMRVGMGWLGLAVMLSVGFMLDVQGQFPGYVALVPLLAASLIIVAGQTGSRFGADRLLTWKPLMRLGDMSYALYLWHWPVLVIYLIWCGQQEVGPVGGTGIIAVSIILAWLTARLVERPLQSSTWANRNAGRSALVVAVCLAVVAAPLASWQQGLKIQADRYEAEIDRNNPGSRVLLPGNEIVYSKDAVKVPTPEQLSSQWGSLTLEEGCDDVSVPPEDQLLKDLCYSSLLPDADKTILVVGDSHPEQWLHALVPMAESRGYDVILLRLGRCSFGTHIETRTDDCNRFNELATDYALKLKPDAVFTVATAANSETAEEVVVPGLQEAAGILAAHDIPLLGMRDNPRFAFNMYQCLQNNGDDAAECVDVEGKLASISPLLEEEGPGSIIPMDMTDMICPDNKCLPVIGNVYVYIDTNHLSGTYIKSMGDEFDRRFHEALGW